MIVVGFTGTRTGMSVTQKRKLLDKLIELKPYVVHHGACVGADEELIEIVKVHLPSTVIVAHPSNLKDFRTKMKSHLERQPTDPLTRNHRIVGGSDVIIAAPKSNQEELRSGTWATIRYARKIGKPVIILERDTTP